MGRSRSHGPRVRVRLEKITEATPAPGTVVSQAGVAVLYVGYRWTPRHGSIAATTERLRAHQSVDVVCATWEAGGKARDLLRSAWRATDAVVSGYLPGNAQAAAQAVLGLPPNPSR